MRGGHVLGWVRPTAGHEVERATLGLEHDGKHACRLQVDALPLEAMQLGARHGWDDIGRTEWPCAAWRLENQVNARLVERDRLELLVDHVRAREGLSRIHLVEDDNPVLAGGRLTGSTAIKLQERAGEGGERDSSAKGGKGAIMEPSRSHQGAVREQLHLFDNLALGDVLLDANRGGGGVEEHLTSG